MSSPESATSVPLQLKPVKTTIAMMGSVLAIIGVIALLILSSIEFDPMQLLIAVAVSGVPLLVSFGLTNNLIQPLEREDPDPFRTGFARLMSVTMVQAALAEGGGLVLFALAFGFNISGIAVLFGIALSVVGMFAITWPTRDRLRRVRERLERNGARWPIDELR